VDFFTTIDSDCKELSMNGIIVIAVAGGIVLAIIIGVLVQIIRNKRGYSKLR